MSETQKTVTIWAAETFGPVGSNLAIAARANREMAELLAALVADDSDSRAVTEAADIVIVLYRMVDRLGGDLMAEIDRKMAINRARRWRLDGNGQGQHIKDGEL